MGFYENKIFPYLLDKQMSKASYADERPLALANASGRILEIGFGTGLNLPHYPAHVKDIVALDINPGMNAMAQRRMLEAGVCVEHHCLNGEILPFEDDSFDSVVSTWTLCSIDNLPSALAEIYRVLKSAGKFFFLEHGLADKPSVQKLQHWITPVQKVIGCGCRLNVAIDRALEEAGFRIDKLDKFILSGTTSPLSGSMYRGIACRAVGN